MRPLNIIVAVDESGGFGKNGKIPWSHPEDLKRFKKITQNGTCIMGRKTYQDMINMIFDRKSKGESTNKALIKPILELLPNRECFVVSRTMDSAVGAKVSRRIKDAVLAASKKEVYIIGGNKIFLEALPWVNTVYMTLVNGHHNCDVFFPVNYLVKNFKIVKGEKKDNLKFLEYKRKISR